MNIPKIVGFISEKRTILFIYRKTAFRNYLIEMKYDKASARFVLGSAFYGRLYPSRCDISPDGRHFIYFAMGGNRKKYEENVYCWTAICSPPIITAQLFIPHNDTWFGGGRFVDDRNISIWCDTEEHHFDKYKITIDKRLSRFEIGKGWQMKEERQRKYGMDYPMHWEKSNGRFIIRRTLELEELYNMEGISRGGFDMYSYTIIHSKTKKEVPLNPCTWADFDNYDRLITSAGSKISIYKNFHEIENNESAINYDLEEILSGVTA
ncbi:hypothetical protein [Riemerella columbina]|uniref:hypothetical protein n=1 Tax=Riemerella columbina TaxID=103810 RepID=UPI0003737EA6|nr:hypothetical protein [Riemerella columbina]